MKSVNYPFQKLVLATYKSLNPKIAAEVNLNVFFICSWKTTQQNKENPQISLTESIRATAIQRGCWRRYQLEIVLECIGVYLT